MGGVDAEAADRRGEAGLAAALKAVAVLRARKRRRSRCKAGLQRTLWFKSGASLRVPDRDARRTAFKVNAAGNQGSARAAVSPPARSPRRHGRGLRKRTAVVASPAALPGAHAAHERRQISAVPSAAAFGRAPAQIVAEIASGIVRQRRRHAGARARPAPADGAGDGQRQHGRRVAERSSPTRHCPSASGSMRAQYDCARGFRSAACGRARRARTSEARRAVRARAKPAVHGRPRHRSWGRHARRGAPRRYREAVRMPVPRPAARSD